MAEVGHSGSQAAQLVQSSVTMVLAMGFLLSARKERNGTAFPTQLARLAPRRGEKELSCWREVGDLRELALLRGAPPEPQKVREKTGEIQS